MKMSNEFLIMFLFVWMLLHSCNPAHGHDIHVSDKPWAAPVEWVAPDEFKDADDKCWHVYKAAEPDTIADIKLHIEEVTCK
jgi:hypothetical protein